MDPLINIILVGGINFCQAVRLLEVFNSMPYMNTEDMIRTIRSPRVFSRIVIIGDVGISPDQRELYDLKEIGEIGLNNKIMQAIAIPTAYDRPDLVFQTPLESLQLNHKRYKKKYHEQKNLSLRRPQNGGKPGKRTYHRYHYPRN